MSKIFAILVDTADTFDAMAHPDHSQRQRAWLVNAANEGKLIAYGPYPPHDGLWIVRAASRDEAEAILKSSPRYQDGALSMERTRIGEWAVSIGKERFS
jgi:uncharacterized protein